MRAVRRLGTDHRGPWSLGADRALSTDELGASQSANEIDRHVGRRVSEFRRAQGISSAELATSLDVSLEQLERYESGVDRLSASKLLIIAHRLQITAEDLFLGLRSSQN